MKKVLSTVLGASLMSVGLVGVSATGAFAAPPGGGQTGQTCDVDNIFSGALTAEYCEGSFSGNDKANDVKNLFQDLYDSSASVTSSVKADDYDGDVDTSLFRIWSPDGDDSVGKIEFKQDIDYKFSFVLKAGNTWSSYFFDGIEAGTILDFTTAGVSKNGNGSAAALSHATMYVSDIEVALREEENKPPKVYVPEPSAVVGLAFLGGGMFLSRRRKSS